MVPSLARKPATSWSARGVRPADPTGVVEGRVQGVAGQDPHHGEETRDDRLDDEVPGAAQGRQLRGARYRGEHGEPQHHAGRQEHQVEEGPGDRRGRLRVDGRRGQRPHEDDGDDRHGHRGPAGRAGQRVEGCRPGGGCDHRRGQAQEEQRWDGQGEQEPLDDQRGERPVRGQVGHRPGEGEQQHGHGAGEGADLPPVGGEGRPADNGGVADRERQHGPPGREVGGERPRGGFHAAVGGHLRCRRWPPSTASNG